MALAGLIEVKTSIRHLLVTLHTRYKVPLLVANKCNCNLELTMNFLLSLTAQYKVRIGSCTRAFTKLMLSGELRLNGILSI